MEAVAIREYTHDVERVFEVVLSIVNKHYNIKNIDKTIRCIEVDSGMSLFSFGGTFEVIVVAQNSGSVVRVRAKSRVHWNITSDMKGKAKKLLDSVEEDLN